MPPYQKPSHSSERDRKHSNRSLQQQSLIQKNRAQTGVDIIRQMMAAREVKSPGEGHPETLRFLLHNSRQRHRL